MRNNTKIRVPRVRPRNAHALSAMSRKSGYMKHRNAPRGGARNEQADILAEREEYEDEYNDFDCNF